MAAYILNKSFINIAVAVMISIKVFSRMEGTFLNGLMETFFFPCKVINSRTIH